ncbi:hypothetical protein ACFW1A_13965 [Kitasatospora sp. NPDC058965]|uniref:hypothetical protein n=1 Tax=Kitasatospora sp. NPDC058965 TaxID=3346682 RepID=UPI0036BBECCA
MAYQQVNGIPGRQQGPAAAPPGRRTAAARRRALLTVGTGLVLLLGLVGYGVYRHLGPDPACGRVGDAVAREPRISADLSAQKYEDLDTELSTLRESLRTGERVAFFPFDSRVGTAGSDTDQYEKDVCRALTPNKLHLYQVTPDLLAADQRKVFADLSGLRSHCAG